MNKKLMTLAVIAAVALFASGYMAGTWHANTTTAPSGNAKTAASKVLYWHDPMVPGQRFDKPGKSPFMDMQLVPVYADGTSTPGVNVSPAMPSRPAASRRALA